MEVLGLSKELIGTIKSDLKLLQNEFGKRLEMTTPPRKRSFLTCLVEKFIAL
jgi:hypothetical protein